MTHHGISPGVVAELHDWARTLDNEGPRYRAIVDGLKRVRTWYSFEAETEQAWDDFLKLLDLIGDPNGAQSCHPSTKAAARRYLARWRKGDPK